MVDGCNNIQKNSGIDITKDLKGRKPAQDNAIFYTYKFNNFMTIVGIDIIEDVITYYYLGIEKNVV